MLYCSTPPRCRGRFTGQGLQSASGPLRTRAATDGHDPVALHWRTRMALELGRDTAQLGRRKHEQVSRTKEGVAVQHRTAAFTGSGVHTLRLPMSER